MISSQGVEGGTDFGDEAAGHRRHIVGRLVFEQLHPLVAGARGREGLESGDSEHGLLWAGQCLGLIDDIPTCAQLITRMVRECQESLARASSMCQST